MKSGQIKTIYELTVLITQNFKQFFQRGIGVKMAHNGDSLSAVKAVDYPALGVRHVSLNKEFEPPALRKVSDRVSCRTRSLRGKRTVDRGRFSESPIGAN